ncbi:hypothetical protein SDC9_120829 [bioreactor metagenome]|uniref:Uncharacterized protein n=1 Tax=bioreactor metagenome TaxID=1076179 RepID=A0A645CA89_9ZZZZ
MRIHRCQQRIPAHQAVCSGHHHVHLNAFHEEGDEHGLAVVVGGQQAGNRFGPQLLGDQR